MVFRLNYIKTDNEILDDLILIGSDYSDKHADLMDEIITPGIEDEEFKNLLLASTWLLQKEYLRREH